MDKFLEWLVNSYKYYFEELHKTCNSNEFIRGRYEAFSDCLIQYNKYHPTTKKLSEIVERLKKETYALEANFINDYKFIYIYKNKRQQATIRIYENKLDNISIEDYVNINTFKWLYQLWIDETEIIIDIDEVES